VKNKEVNSLSFAFHPKATNCNQRQVFWLAQFSEAFPSAGADSGEGIRKTINELTATGIAPDFHRIPY